MPSYDAVIVGGGHNGLVCAGYLAGAGLSVCVVERSPILGGPAGKREFLPGYFTTYSNSPGSFEPKIAQELDLARHGLHFRPQDPTLVHPFDDGRLFVAWRDRQRTAAQFDRFAPGEAARYDAFFQYLQGFADKLGISLFRPPPDLQTLVRNLTSPEDQEAFARIFFGSLRDLFEQFELSWETKSVLGPLGTVGGIQAPSTPGTPLNYLTRPLSLASIQADGAHDPRRQPLRGATGFPVGGFGAIVDSLVACARSRGVVLRPATAVRHIRIRNGVVKGIVAGKGEEIDASIVISAVNPRLTLLELIGDEPEWHELRAKMALKRMKGKACKLVLALEGMPRWGAAKSDEEAHALAGAQFRIAPTLDYLEEAHMDMMLGRPTVKPVIWGLCPSMHAPELAPPGKHLLSLNIGNAPYDLTSSDWPTERDRLAKACIKSLTQWMPGLPDLISDYRCVDPHQIEEELGLYGANITHGDNQPWNQFWMRPLPGLHRYRTPTHGLYLSGVGTWPGNYVSGIPGHNTGQAVLEDLRERRIALAGTKTSVSVQ